MQPSQSEIQREFEALRDIRRRSTSQGGPGTLLLDPDLPTSPPSPNSPLSPHSYFAASAATSESSSSSSRQDGSGNNGGDAAADDPFHLFWVPAHLHPELAPGEFRAFLKEHARAPAEGTSASASPSRSPSTSSSLSGLGRKRSMLSKQYKPRENDGVESEESVVPLQRNRSQRYDNMGPQLTISDLQKLEELAEEASKSDDPSKLRSVLRRSLSLNVSPSAIDQMDEMPDMGDEADSPIIVPRPNQILRRAARTKIRKPGLAGDGGGHRFANTRKRPGRATTVDVHSPTDGSSSGHGDVDSPQRSLTGVVDMDGEESEESYAHRRITYTEETMIYDAYATEEPEEVRTSSYPTTPPMVIEIPAAPTSPQLSPPQTEPEIEREPILHHPQPQRHLTPPIPQPSRSPSRTPSPESVSYHSAPEETRYSPTHEPPSFLSTSPTTTDKRKDKDKKNSILRKWGSDKGSKKASKEKDREREREKEKEKEGGFFGSLFGGSRKKHEEPSTNNLGQGGAGPATAAALLGASKSSRDYQPPPSPQLAGAYARYPIHVERAVYRLSHIKLANPRRPLYEQVLISNLMFWYLGVINKTQQNPGQNQNQQGQPVGQTGPSGAQGQSPEDSPTSNNGPDKERLEEEEREREREREERARAERERMEKEQEREKLDQRRETRRGGLTKTPAGSAGSSRRAEMPVKGPQYGLQHQAIEQEYSSTPMSIPMSRTASAPPSPGSAGSGYNGGYSHRPQSQSPPATHNYYYSTPSSPERSGSRSAQQNLPPGAMPPVAYEQSWLASSLSSSNSPSRSPPPSRTSPPNSADGSSVPPRPPRTSRSPPPRRPPTTETPPLPSGGKLPSRSLSANAAPAEAMARTNGNLKKKVASVNAASGQRPPVLDLNPTGEEEDVPLAVWQQQQRK